MSRLGQIDRYLSRQWLLVLIAALLLFVAGITCVLFAAFLATAPPVTPASAWWGLRYAFGGVAFVGLSSTLVIILTVVAVRAMWRRERRRDAASAGERRPER